MRIINLILTALLIFINGLQTLSVYGIQIDIYENIFYEKDEKEKNPIYLNGIEALKSGDTTKAIILFKESLRKFDDAASHFQLAKIYLNQNSFQSRNLAYENFRFAVLKEPNNLEYRFSFANLMKEFARVSSFNEYKKILELDSTQIQAWLNLAEMKAKDFNEFNKSVRDMGEMYGSLQEYADDDFRESESYFKIALAKDSLNYDALLNLSLLYDRAGKSKLGIPLLKKLIDNKKVDKKIHLCLGLLYYKEKKFKEAYDEYKSAISLMDYSEKEDFVFYSVKMMLSPKFEDVFNKYDDDELREFFDLYWKASDPLYLTDYNERLIEHYSRVALATLNFGVPSKGIIGWKSNMGETIIRYGEPLDRMRIRPQFREKSIGMKTEVWNYEDMTFAFTDLAQSGNFQFAWPASEKDKFTPQVQGNYHDLAEELRRARPVYYSPKFEGPIFESHFTLSQFRNNDKRNHTDLYLTYNFSVDDSLFNKSSDSLEHKFGFFFFDKNYDEQFTSTVNEKLSKDDLLINHNLFFTLRPDSGFASFEVLRGVDKGVSANHFPLTISKFSNDRLDISSITFASDVKNEAGDKNYFKRGGVFINPKIDQTFSNSDKLFIYFEIYNLAKDENGLTDFEQSIIVSEIKKEKSVLEKVFSSIAEFFGLTSSEKITLSSNYKTFESNPQIYFAIDLSSYESGNYLVTVKIKDNINGSEKEISKALNWSSSSEISK